MENNKIYYTPDSSILLCSQDVLKRHQEKKQQQKPTYRNQSQQDNINIQLKPVKVPQRSRQISITKELDYFVKQQMKEKLKEKQRLLREEFESFRYQNKEIFNTNPYADKKLRKNFLNLDFTDEQRETYALRLGRLAIKHNEQIKKMQKIAEDIHKKQEENFEQNSKFYPETMETLVTENDSQQRTKNLYNRNILAEYQNKKYQHFWNRLPKTLVD